MSRIAVIVALALAVGVPSACAQNTAPNASPTAASFTMDPVMTRGAASAPVTIVEFSDYQ
jgi:protein-disulfide isomerase